jgi:hypothetical protein
MKLTSLFLLAGGLTSAAVLHGQINVNFDGPSKSDATPGASGIFEYGYDGTADGLTPYVLGTWGYVGNGGIDDGPAGDGSGVGSGNERDSTGVARPQTIAGTNARAVGVIFDGSVLTPGVQYTLTFDVIGGQRNDLGTPADGTDSSGRFWLAEVGGINANGGVAMDVSFNGWGAANRPFYTQGTGAFVNYLTPDDTGTANGTNIVGEELVDLTTENSFSFTYTAGTDIAFAVGTYNNNFAIDNVAIVPEPSHFALALGVAFLGFAVWRRRRS